MMMHPMLNIRPTQAIKQQTALSITHLHLPRLADYRLKTNKSLDFLFHKPFVLQNLTKYGITSLDKFLLPQRHRLAPNDRIRHMPLEQAVGTWVNALQLTSACFVGSCFDLDRIKLRVIFTNTAARAYPDGVTLAFAPGQQDPHCPF